MSDDEREAEIRARLAVVTPGGEWRAVDGALLADGEDVLSCCNLDDRILEFIAHSRADVQWLLARLDAERELIARIYHLCELPDLSDREVRSAIRDMCGAVLAASGTATGGDGDDVG